MTDNSASLVDRQAILDALHEQLPYPTEACAIVRSVEAITPSLKERERPTDVARQILAEGSGSRGRGSAGHRPKQVRGDTPCLTIKN